MLVQEQLTEAVIGAAIDVHRALGPGLLESAYEQCLRHELSLRGISFKRQVELPVVYKAVHLDCGYRMDLVVEDQVVVEIKTVERLAPVHDAQLLTYLKLSGKRVGLLLNFYAVTLHRGIRRLVL
jgi:GxxExxY protein